MMESARETPAAYHETLVHSRQTWLLVDTGGEGALRKVQDFPNHLLTDRLGLIVSALIPLTHGVVDPTRVINADSEKK